MRKRRKGPNVINNRDKEQMRSLSAEPKFRKVMREYSSGDLRSSSGATPDIHQARAIAFSEAERHKEGKY